MNFGERLTQAMRDEGITVGQMVDLTGLDEPHVCKLRRNGIPNTGVRTLAKLLRALPNTDARRLICGNEQPTTHPTGQSGIGRVG